MSEGIRELEGFDLVDLVYEATCQIPEGMVSTYGDIATAIGDVRAARAIGLILSRYPRRGEPVPCHRVVYGDGKVGWYNGSGKGSEEKASMLEEEGVPISDGRVIDFPKHRYQDVKVRPVLSEMQREQDQLAEQVTEEGEIRDVRYAVGLDVSYTDDVAYAAACIYDLETGAVSERTSAATVSFPYIPSYLGFREVPAVAPLLEGLEDAVLLVDGQGRLHPRRFGIACHLGVRFGLPTVGVAKSHLTGEVGPDGWIDLAGRRSGRLVRAGSKDYYVSVGNRITLQEAVAMAERCLSRKESDVLRQAHVLANKVRKGRT